MTWEIWEAPYTLIPSITAASPLFSSGTIQTVIPASTAVLTIGRIPLTRFSSPPSPSSPANRIFFVFSAFTIPIETSSPTADGRSNAVPLLYRSAGDRLMVILDGGRQIPMLRSATRILCLASPASLLRQPTISIHGSPCATSTSTWTR